MLYLTDRQCTSHKQTSDRRSAKNNTQEQLIGRVTYRQLILHCNGMCVLGYAMGELKTCALSSLNSVCAVYFMNFEEGLWRAYILREVSMKDMKLFAIHPHCKFMIYLYSKSKTCIFLCDYKYQELKLESIYTAADDEYIHAWGSVMSLPLPKWPTPSYLECSQALRMIILYGILLYL